MDMVLPLDAFGEDGEGAAQGGEGGGAGGGAGGGGGRVREHMLDVSVIEMQCPAHVEFAARDPKICCEQREKEKKDHYSEFYDRDCYTLATVAIGSFGFLGQEAVGVVRQMAKAYAARNFTGESSSNQPLLLKPSQPGG